jgi:hypothetical protein
MFNTLLNIRDFNGYSVTVVLANFEEENGGLPSYRSLNIKNEIASEFLEIATHFLDKYRKIKAEDNLKLLEYTGGYKPGEHEIEWIDLSKEEKIRDIISSIPTAAEIPLLNFKGNFIKQLRFYVLILERKGDKILLFRKYGESKELTRSKNLLLQKMGTRFDKLAKPTFQFDLKFDIIVCNGFLYSFNKINMHHNFRYLYLFKAAAKDALDFINENIVPISGIEEFKVDCAAHLQKTLKVLDIRKKDYLKKININDIKKVIEGVDKTGGKLNVKIVEVEEVEGLIYDKKDKWVILNILDDNYLRSFMIEKSYETSSKIDIEPSSPQPPPAPEIKQNK